MAINAFEEKYDMIQLDGFNCLFTNQRLDRSSIPTGLHCYDVRDSDALNGSFAEVAPSVLVNHWGTILCKDPFPLDEEFSYHPKEAPNFVGKTMTLPTFLRMWRDDSDLCFEDPDWKEDPSFAEKAKSDFINSFQYNSSFGEITVYPRLSMYRDDDNLYVGLEFYDEEEGLVEHFGDVTVNVDSLPYLHSTIDTNNNGAKILDFLEKNGFGQRTDIFVPSGYCMFPVFRFNEDMIKRLDPQVLADHAKSRGVTLSQNNKPLDEKIHTAEQRATESAPHLHTPQEHDR